MMNPDRPQSLVTIYMPTYNRVELLQRAVSSVLKQDYRNIELIVVDDNSTDGTHKYLSEMADEDPRFKYFINEKNSGACASRNKAIFAAKGEFITGLDDDDYFLPNRISSFMSKSYVLEKEYVALYSNQLVKVSNNPKLLEHKRIKSCSHNQLLIANWIGNQLFTKTSYLKKINGFETMMPAWQDLECWYRLLKQYDREALLLPQSTYIVDTSHPHERISRKKITSIIDAYNIFCTKHYLSSKEREVLELQLYTYKTNPIKFSSIFNVFIRYPSLANLKRTALFLGSNTKRTVNTFVNKTFSKI